MKYTALPLAADLPAHPRMRVVEIVYETPATPATALDRQDEAHWWVRCEGEGCGNVITVGKRHWRPTDFSDPQSSNVEVRLTAPGARWCLPCGAERFMPR